MSVTVDEIENLPNRPEVLLIDVRDPPEIKATGLIPTSINIPCKLNILMPAKICHNVLLLLLLLCQNVCIDTRLKKTSLERSKHFNEIIPVDIFQLAAVQTGKHI